MEPTEYLRAIRRRWLVVVLATLVFAGGAWATTAIASPTDDVDSYEARAVLLRTGGSLSLDTMTAFVGLRPVAVRVAERLEFDGDPLELMVNVGAESDRDAGLLVITATATSPEEARALANSYSRSLIDYIADSFGGGGGGKLVRDIAELQEEIAGLDARLEATLSPAQASILRAQRVQSAATLSVLSEAYQQSVAARLSGPGMTVVQPAYLGDQVASAGLEVPTSTPVRLTIGAILGLALGIALALVLARFDTRIRSREAAEEHFQLPVLAEIPVIKRADRKGVVTASDRSSAAGEAFSLLGAEILRQPVLDLDGDAAAEPRRGPQTILVTSAGNSEGKSTVVANVAVAMSEMGKRVLVVSCDFRRPTVHRLFGVPNLEGLAQALELESTNGKPVLEGHIQTTPFSDIWLVPSGPASKRPGELLNSGEMRRALSEARSAADVILLDTAPILAGSDATDLVPDVDAVLMVARSGTTTSQLAVRASGLLRRLRAPVLGVAFNAAESPAAPRSVRAK